MKKKIYLLLCAFAIIFGNANGQEWFQKVQSNPNATLMDYQNAFKKYSDQYNMVKPGVQMKSSGKTEKIPAWKQFKRWEWYWEQRTNPFTGEFPQTSSFEEWESFKSTFNAQENLGDWVNLGTSSSKGGYSGIGRINCIAFHPTDKNTIWVGTPAGGIWKTTDNGKTWSILNDQESVLGVSAIALHPDYETNHTIFIGTGDRDGFDTKTAGVFKSTDDGATWTQTAFAKAESNYNLVGDLKFDPTNSNRLLIAAHFGIYELLISENSLKRLHKENFLFNDIEFKPDDPKTIYVSTSTRGFGGGNAFIVKSTDSGDTWSKVKEFNFDDSRCEIAVSKNDPLVIYAVVAKTNSSFGGVYKSTDGGDTFQEILNNSGKNILGYYADGSSTRGQGNYDLCIAVSPKNANEVYVGGINTWTSQDGGKTWVPNNMWTGSSTYVNDGGVYPTVHADKHCLVYQNDTTLFEGNDGGIYFTINKGKNWYDLSNGLTISQLYKVACTDSDKDLILTGLQDNGSKLKYKGNWYDVSGGDGTSCMIDHQNSNTMYTSYVNGTFYRTTDLFQNTFTVISDNITGSPEGAWVTPLEMNPNKSSTIYAGLDKVYKSENKGDTWTAISEKLSTGTIRYLKVAKTDPNYIYAADRTNIWLTKNEGKSWNKISSSTGIENSSITSIFIHPWNKEKIFVTCGGYTDNEKVFYSDNAGQSWNNISNGLPNIPSLCLITNTWIQGRDQIYVGTDHGVFMKDGINTEWVRYSKGLPNTIVNDLQIYRDMENSSNSRLRAATYGRGVWESPLHFKGGETSTFDSEVSNSQIKVYPNPTEGLLNIKVDELPQNASLEIYSMNGIMVHNQKVSQTLTTIDLDKLSLGVYILKIVSENGKVMKTKFTLK